MSTTTLLPGVRVHPNGRSYQVRIHPYPPRAGFALTDNGAQHANEYATELRRRKRQGILVPPDEHVVTLTTLADVTREHLTRLETVGGRRGRPYSPDGMKQARKEARPWLGEPVAPYYVKGGVETAPRAVDAHGVPFGQLPLAAIAVRPIEVYLERRSEKTPRAAVGEYQMLLAILRLAARRGETFEQGLLALEPLRRRTRRRHGLSLADLRYLVAHAPEHQRRVFLLGGTLGCRIMELLRIEDAWLGLDECLLTIPAWASKERRDKPVDLLPEEVILFREQQLVRSPDTVSGQDGTPLLFPRRHGTAWTHGGFWNDVVHPVRERAARAWRVEHDLFTTPFDTFAPHDLRRGAATLLRELGVDADLVASRFGHADHGQLIEKTYADDTRRKRLRATLDAIAADGGIDSRLALIGAGGAQA